MMQHAIEIKKKEKKDRNARYNCLVYEVIAFKEEKENMSKENYKLCRNIEFYENLGKRAIEE